MRYAVIDTGSNTIRMGIYEEENGKLKQIYNHAVFANLAGYIKDGVLLPDGICAAEAAIASHMKTAKEYSCTPCVFATAAIRNAKNTEEICQRISDTCHLTVDVLTGEEEALFSFYGAVSDFPCQSGVMADVGGGSSEIISFYDKTPDTAISVPWGSLKAYRTFVSGTLPTKAEADAIKSAITEALAQNQALCNTKAENLCIVGGGVRASVALCNEFFKTEILSVAAIDEMLSIIVSAPDRAEKIIQRLTPDRLNTITPALAIYSAVGNFFGAHHVFVSDQGIKEGYIFKKMMA